MPTPHDTLTHRNRIISDLYTSPDFNQCINKMEPQHLRDDLRNEVMLILCEKPCEVIIGLNSRGELRWYVVRVILNMVKSYSSPFTKKYRARYSDLKIHDREFAQNRDNQSEGSLFFYKKIKTEAENIPDHGLNGRVYKECQEQAILHFIQHELYWYDKEIVQMYMRFGSYRAIEKETGIPWESAYGTVRRIQDRIKKEVLNVTE